MKMLVERIPVSTSAPFDLVILREYNWVTGDHADETLSKMAWEAAADVENFGQLALLRQTVSVTILDLIHPDGMTLPVGPVAAGATVGVTIDGQASTDFDVVPGRRPYLSWSPWIRGKASARVVIDYEAGFGDDKADIPEDIGHAIIDQVFALYWHGRAVDGEHVPRRRSMTLSRVAARYRGVSL